MGSSNLQSKDNGRSDRQRNGQSPFVVGILCLVVVAFTLLSSHYLSGVLSLAFLAAGAVGFVKRRNMKATSALFFAWFVSLLLPIDIAFRAANTLMVNYVPVVTASHSNRGVCELESRGLLQNRDFVVY